MATAKFMSEVSIEHNADDKVRSSTKENNLLASRLFSFVDDPIA